MTTDQNTKENIRDDEFAMAECPLCQWVQFNANAQLISIEDTAVNIPVTVIVPIDLTHRYVLRSYQEVRNPALR
jgi:hypothetical protein